MGASQNGRTIEGARVIFGTSGKKRGVLSHALTARAHYFIETADFEVELNVGDVIHGSKVNKKYEGVTWEESSFIIALKNNKPAGHAPGLCGLGADPLTKGHACKKCMEGSTEAELCECDEWYDGWMG